VSVALKAFVDELEKIAEFDDVGASMPQDQLPAVDSARVKQLLKNVGVQALGMGTGMAAATGLGYLGKASIERYAPRVAPFIFEHKLPIIGGLGAVGALSGHFLAGKMQQLIDEASAKAKSEQLDERSSNT
jgi:hypothetical protein